MIPTSTTHPTTSQTTAPSLQAVRLMRVTSRLQTDVPHDSEKPHSHWPTSHRPFFNPDGPEPAYDTQ